jgi:hypothetical protein
MRRAAGQIDAKGQIHACPSTEFGVDTARFDDGTAQTFRKQKSTLDRAAPSPEQGDTGPNPRPARGTTTHFPGIAGRSSRWARPPAGTNQT